jgi:hypothetical protein
MVFNVGNMADINEDRASFESQVHTQRVLWLVQSYEDLPTILVSFWEGKGGRTLVNHTSRTANPFEHHQ